jgi:hypothetical protein
MSAIRDCLAVLKPTFTTVMPKNFRFFEMPQVPGSFCINNLPVISITVGESIGKEESKDGFDMLTSYSDAFILYAASSLERIKFSILA